MAKSGYITITQDSQSIPNNTSNITVKGYVKTTGESYRGEHRTGKYSIYQGGALIYSGTFTHGAPANSNTQMFSKTLTVSHASDGTSGKITASFDYDGGWATGSGSLNLSQIPRQATITSAPNFTDEDNPEIKYTNSAGNTVSSLQACIASSDGKTVYVPYRDIGKTGTSYTFNLTESEREALRNASVNSKSLNVRFYIKTVIGSTNYYSSLPKTLTIINAAPSLEVSVEDVNTSTLALTGDKNVFVRYESNAQYNMTAQALKGATIESYSVVCGNKSSSSQNGIINSVESGIFQFFVTDSRGYTTTVVLNKKLIEYLLPTCVLVTHQPSADGHIDIDVSGNCFSGSFGNFDNNISVQYRYKSEYDDDYLAWVEIDDVTFEEGKYHVLTRIEGLDYSLQYTFQAQIIDSFSSAVTKEFVVRFFPVFYWGKDRFFFNVPINFMEGALADFVVEQGNDGIWSYRKWASGISECWGKTVLEDINCGANNYSGFYYSDGISIDFPIDLFIENPVTSFEGGSQNYINLIRDFGSSRTSAYFLVVGHMDMTSNITVRVQAKGRWK